MKFILSYPRSGNHLVRFLSEYITGGFTQGCLGNVKDLGIYLNDFTPKDILEHVSDSNQIALKAHSVKEIKQSIDNTLMSNNGVLSIHRSPLTALASHSGAALKLPDEEFEVYVNNQFNIWTNILVTSFKSYTHNIIWYEKLTSDDIDTRVTEIAKIATFFKGEVLFDKLALLCSSTARLYSISSGGKGRAWGGSKSLTEKYHHLYKMPEDKLLIFMNVIQTRLSKLKSELHSLMQKHPKIKNDDFYVSISNYLAETEDFRDSLNTEVLLKDTLSKVTYVPIGFSCSVAHFLRKTELRKDAYPFDWCCVPFSSASKLIENDFTDFLLEENIKFFNKEKRMLFEDDGVTLTQLNSEVTPVICMKYNILYPHDVAEASGLELVKEKYKARIVRLLELCNSDERVVFVYNEGELNQWQSSKYQEVSSPFENTVNDSDILRFLEMFKSKFKKEVGIISLAELELKLGES
jgi:hypothetical protein